MKRFLKRSYRWIILGLGTVFIVYGFAGAILNPNIGWKLFYVIIASVWLVIVLVAMGILEKTYDWWQKD